MANIEKFDITVFGASSLTGKEIIRHILQLSIDRPDFYPFDFIWAIADRDAKKIKQTIDELLNEYPIKINKPTILIATMSSNKGLDSMTKQTKVLINAANPLTIWGENVVRSCVENGCHYVDVSGEIEFIERMQRKYHEKAKSNNTTIVHSCGFSSVPSDLGVVYTKNLYKQNGWIPSDIEMSLKLHCGQSGLYIGYNIFKSAIYTMDNKVSSVQKISNVLFHKNIKYSEHLGYHVPYLLSDPSIVNLSQQLYSTESKVSQPPIKFSANFMLPSLWAVILYVIYGFIFSIFARHSWGCQLLLEYPEFFSAGIISRKCATKKQLKQNSFEMIVCSNGYDPTELPNNKSFKVVIRGPEASYVATSRIVLQSALTILNHKDKGIIPSGVMTPAVAFYNTDLIDHLRYVGITFDVSK